MKRYGINFASARLAIAAVSLATLAACGGGTSDDAPGTVGARPQSISTAPADIEKASSSTIDQLLTQAQPLSVSTATSANRTASSLSEQTQSTDVVALDEPSPPSGCRLMYFGGLGVRCMIPGEDLYTGSGTDASSIAAPAPFCQEITVGQLQYGVTPVPGSIACYQFTVSTSTTLNFEVVLPAGVVGTAELHRMLTNGSGFPLARSKSPTNPLAGTATTQYQRVILVVRTANGPGNQVFGLGINATVPQPLPTNNVVADARPVDMNEIVNGELNSSTDTAYYFYPLDVGQTTAIVTATFNSATVEVGYRPAKRTAPGTYTLLTETVVSASDSNGAQLGVSSGYAANTAGTTTPAGILIRVKGTSPSGPSNPPFVIRVGQRAVTLDSGFDIVNTESISRWFPTSTPWLQAANYITAQRIGVKDGNGAWVKNHPVRLTVQRFNSDSSSKQIATYTTNHEGKAAINGVLNTAGTVYPITTNFAAGCSGALLIGTNYGPIATPRDHWNGTAQPASVTAELLGAFPVVSNSTTFTVQFTRICSETYLGYY